MSVAGRRILVPVTAGRRDLAERLRAAGALVDEVEFIEVVETAQPEVLAAATLEWCDGAFDWLAVTSRNAVLAMAAVATANARSLADPVPFAQVATVGEATRSVCAGVGLDVALVPSGTQDARGIVADFPEGPGRVLVPLGDLAGPVLARGLERKGWDVTKVEAYRVVDGPGISADTAAALAAGEFDAVLLTSGSVAERYAPHAAPEGTLVVAIGRTTQAAAKGAGLTVGAVAAIPSHDGILEALENAWNTREDA
ncbi:uroporphyrinogen-III synthase [Demequina sp.]|uniref:uroporphyrinogen-III synthase n=1 Tax=Demequina sp. TaxID=2050685 RepID=UPI003D0C56A9